MAITKKHLEVQAQKHVLQEQIMEVVRAGLDVKAVPPAVVNGSHQDVCAWKELVANYFSGTVFGWPTRASLEDLKAMLPTWQKRYDQLTGKSPLPTSTG